MPKSTVRLLGGDPSEAEELVRVRLWERDEPGYRIHNFARYNRTKAQVHADRAQRSIAGKLGADARWTRSPATGSKPYS